MFFFRVVIQPLLILSFVIAVSGTNLANGTTSPPPSLWKIQLTCSAYCRMLPSTSVLCDFGSRVHQCVWQCGQRHQDQCLHTRLHHLSCTAQTLRVPRHPPRASPLLWHRQCGVEMAPRSTFHRHWRFYQRHGGWTGWWRHYWVRFRVC